MSTPQVQQLNADVCVAGQLDPAAMAWAAQAGFKSVINNRPDFEGGPADQERRGRHPFELQQFSRLMGRPDQPMLAVALF